MTGVGVTLQEPDAGKKLKFNEFYATEERLRSGSYGTVYTCRHSQEAAVTYAVKVLDRTKMKEKDDAAVFREVEIMRELRELPHVVRLMDFFVEPETLYVVQHYAKGGDVFDRLAKRTTYTEKDARDLAETLLETINSLHKKSIVHRDVSFTDTRTSFSYRCEVCLTRTVCSDTSGFFFFVGCRRTQLKPENLLLAEVAEDSNILLADFGFARHVSQENLCKTRCGTPGRCRRES